VTVHPPGKKTTRIVTEGCKWGVRGSEIEECEREESTRNGIAGKKWGRK